jgi:hypothetical protein
MSWQKVIFSQEQIGNGEYQHLHDQFESAFVTDPIRYNDVCVGTTYPLDGLIDGSDDPPTMTAYFSRDAFRYFSNLIAPYSPEPCDAPLGIRLSLSCVDHDRWARILANS